MRRVVVFALFVVLVVGSGFATAAAEAKEVDWISTKASDVEVFMVVGASTRQLDRVERTIRSTDAVQRYAFVDHQLAYREFKRIFRKKPKLVRSIRPSDLPESFRLELTSKSAAEDFAGTARRLPGVESAEVTIPPNKAEALTLVRDCQLRAGSTFEVFMQVDATQSELDATVRAHRVAAVASRSTASAHPAGRVTQQFQQIFASQPDVLEKATGPQDLPMSIRVHADRVPIGRGASSPARRAPGCRVRGDAQRDLRRRSFEVARPEA